MLLNQQILSRYHMNNLRKLILSNGVVLYESNQLIKLRLPKPTLTGDIGSNIPCLDSGVYNIHSVFDNFYGTFIRILHNNHFYDIEPRYFEYHKEDQLPTQYLLPFDN